MNNDITFDIELPEGRFVVYKQKPDFEFLKVNQIHSNIVLPENQLDSENADGIIGESLIPKAILTADCVPLVLIGSNKHAVIHAGWKGLAQEILMHPLILAMKPQYAFIGPHIRQSQYEVQADFLNHFPLYQDAFSTISGKIYFDLSLVVESQLSKTYPGIYIEDYGPCTFNETRFHSYRRDKTTQRNWNIYFP